MSCSRRFFSFWLSVLSLFGGLVLPNGSEARAAGRKYALVVGVREYDSAKFENLKFTENDTEELADLLVKEGGFTVRLLTTSRGKDTRRDAPTAKNLRAAVEALLSRKTRDDTVLVALSGHGIQARVKEGRREKDDSFFCPADAQLNDNDTLISLSKLFEDLNDCGAGVKLLLVDACREARGARSLDVDTLPRPPRGIAALFSCKADEKAFETAKLGRGHGVFFHFVLEGLRGKAKNSRGEVTWSRLAEYVTDQVSDEVPILIGAGAKQTPHEMRNIIGKSPVLVSPSKRGISNSIGMKLVRIPAGRFLMGSPRDEDGRSDSEQRHEVEITRDFLMGAYPVTQAEYEKVMGANPSLFSRTGDGRDKVKGMDTSRFPVEMVSWEEAKRFCEKLSALPAEKKAGRSYRLPTEAEWEYACRARATTAWFAGASLTSKHANFGDSRGRTTEVGSCTANAWGLYDMHGNVWQWCADWYDRDYYKTSPKKDPCCVKVGTARVLRGGSWFIDARSCRSASRNSGEPGERLLNVGFRVVCVPRTR